MSYLSFENNIIEASGNLILKSTSGSIDCSGATISNVTIAGNMVVTSIEPSNNDISFNNSNLLDVSSIQVNNNVSCSSLTVDTISSINHNISFSDNNLLDVSSIQVKRIDATDIYVDGSLTVINTIDLDISDNIIGLNRGNTSSMSKNTSGMLINYGDASNIFFGYHDQKNAFVIADTSYNHNDDSRNIVLDKYVDLKAGKIDFEFDTLDKVKENSYSTLFNDYSFNDTSFCSISDYKWNAYYNYGTTNTPYVPRSFQIQIPCYDSSSLVDVSNNLKDAPIIFKTNNNFAFMVDDKCIYLDGNTFDFTHRQRRIYNNDDAMHIQTYDKVIFGLYKSGNPLTIDISNQKIEGKYDVSCSSLTVNTIGFENHDISFNNSNLLDVSSILVTNKVQAFSFNATSDYRTKTNIEELDENITVSNLRPLVYLKNGQKEIGLLAHELQEVYPFMVCGEKDGEQMQSVNYNGLIGVLINDIKRLTNENQILKSRLDSLEEKFNKKFE